MMIETTFLPLIYQENITLWLQDLVIGDDLLNYNLATVNCYLAMVNLFQLNPSFLLSLSKKNWCASPIFHSMSLKMKIVTE
jgi:hypothetical protein